VGDEASRLGEWLKAKCDEEGLSLRQVANKTALPQTIKKLAEAFGGDHHQLIALEDKLLSLAGYRSERPEEALSEPLARILDKLNALDVAQLGIVEQFADFILRMEKQGRIK